MTRRGRAFRRTAGASPTALAAACAAALAVGPESVAHAQQPPSVVPGPATAPPTSFDPAVAAQPPAGGSATPPRSVIPWLRDALDNGAPAEAAAPAGPEAGASPTLAPLRPIRPSASPALAAPPAAAAPQAPAPPQDPLNAAASPTPPPPPGPDRGAAATPAAIEVAALDGVEAAAAGAAFLIPAEAAGLDPSFWRGASMAAARAAVDRLAPSPHPAANRLALGLLTARLQPPSGGGAAAFGAARIQALHRYGAAERATSLAEAAGPAGLRAAASPALISGRDAAVCEALVAEPDPSTARIYCQIVLGDLLAAGLALDASRALGGDLTPEAQADLDRLGAMIDQALEGGLTGAGSAVPASLSRPTPTTAVGVAALRRLGAAPPTNFARTAPLALTPAALAPDAPPRLRLEALERLEAAGVVETEMLRAAFEAQRSAESGGVWGRVEAYQAAMRADAAAFDQAAGVAMARASEAGREGAMARLLARRAAELALPASGRPTPALANTAIRRLLRLGGEASAAAALTRAADAMGPPAVKAGLIERAFDHLAEPDWPGGWDQDRQAALDAQAARGDQYAGLIAAAVAAMTEPAGPVAGGPAPPGLALVNALATLGESSRTRPETLAAALRALRAMGLDAEARNLAIEASVAAR